jgi:hypothetical protein
MALVYTNTQGAVHVEEVKAAYARLRRFMDALIDTKGGGSQSNNQAIADAMGCALADTGAVFDAFDAMMAGMTTAQNAGTAIDRNAL